LVAQEHVLVLKSDTALSKHTLEYPLEEEEARADGGAAVSKRVDGGVAEEEGTS
jgi:hypothetical protein